MSIQEKAETLARGVLHDELANLQIEIGTLRAENERLRQRVETLRVALERFGCHDLECDRAALRTLTQRDLTVAAAPAKCNCGLTAALEENLDLEKIRRYVHGGRLPGEGERDEYLRDMLLEIDRLRRQVRAYQSELVEVCQTLGPALGYPRAGPEIGGDGTAIMIGEHTPGTLAAEAARKLANALDRRAGEGG